MATYYVHGETGSDANSGLTSALAKKTFNSLVATYTLATGDTIYVAEKIRANTALFTGAATSGPGLLSMSSLSNVVITQEAGQAQADVRGDWELVQTGWSASTNAWQLTLTGAAASQPDAVVYKWDANVDSDGHHYGHLVPDSLANCQNATGAVGRYNYNTTTKVLTVYLGTSVNPNTSGYPVGVCWVPTSQEGAIKFTGGSGNRVVNVNFSLFPSQTSGGQNGWAILFMSSPNSVGSNCTGRDMGAHTFGSYASGSSSSGCSFSNCLSHSGRAGGGGAFIHYTTSAFTLSATNTNCTAHVYKFLGTDGLARLDGSAAMDAISGVPFYSHADSGTPVTLIQNIGCTVRYYHDPGFGCKAFGAANTPTVATPSSYSSYACQCDQCSIIGSGQEYYTDGGVAFRRCILTQSKQLPDGTGGTRGAWTLWTGASDGFLYFEACQFIADLSDGSAGAGGPVRFFSCTSNSGLSLIHFVNCSFHDVSTQAATDFRAWFDYISVNANLYRVTGCGFSYLTSGGTKALCIADATTSAANHGFIDSVYWQIGTGRYSQVAALDTAAEWLSAVDTSAVVPASAPFLNAPTDLSITAASPLRTRRRATSAVVPKAGINGPYIGMHGAWQLATGSVMDSSPGGGGSVVFGDRRSRLRGRR